MGIQGLLPALKSITTPANVKDYAGLRVAVDTYSWLHKAAFSCSKEICSGQTTSKFINYCMHRVNLLRHHGIKPLLIFDGGPLPMKAEQEEKRSRVRSGHLERARQADASGNHGAAYEYYQKAVDITPEIAFQLILVLREENVDFIVSPYEADAQMAYLSLNGFVDVVITEDSDLVAYGCPKIFFKMDKHGHGVEFQYADLVRNKELNFSSFTKRMMLELCIFSGCDYLPSLQGMGVKRAHNLLRRFRNHQKIIRHLRFSGVMISKAYEQCFEKALLTFCHHRVYDPTLKQMVHLTEVPADYHGDLEFLGSKISQTVVVQIAKGVVHPVTHAPFQMAPVSCDEPSPVCASSDNKQSSRREQRSLDLPAQRNVLTNYFISKSEASTQQFKAPRSSQDPVIFEEYIAYSPEEDVEISRATKRLCVQQDESSQHKVVVVQAERELEPKRGSPGFPKFNSKLLGDDLQKKNAALCSRVDHTETYASIAQESIDRFTASFKQPSHGARVSGLRPPNYNNNSSSSSSVFNQFALTSAAQTNLWRRV